MPSTHTSLHDHLVFPTKNREPWFTAEFRPKLHNYMGGTIKGLDANSHAAGGITDHVHLLIGLKPSHTLCDVLRELKACSSKWVKEQLRMSAFAWQEGYGAFTVSPPDLEKVRHYVLNQESHHRTLIFAVKNSLRFRDLGCGYKKRAVTVETATAQNVTSI